MNAWRQKPGAAERRPPPSRQSLRRGWDDAIRFALLAGADALRAADAPEPFAAGANHARFRQSLRDLAEPNFPVEAWSARVQAAAFLILARGFTNEAMAPESRTACAPFLIAGAKTLDALMTTLRDTESQAWRGQTGERD